MHSPVVAVRARGLPFLLYRTRFGDNITPDIAKVHHRFDISSNPLNYLGITPAIKETVRTKTTMKTNATSTPGPRSRALFTLFLGATALWATPAAAGQIFVESDGDGTVGEYTTSGATVNASLLSGFNSPNNIAVSGGNLFVTDDGNGRIGEYSTSGVAVNAFLVSGLNSPYGIAVSGGNLFATDRSTGTIGEYTTSGALVNGSLVSGLHNPDGIAVSGGNLFVVNAGDVNSFNGTIGEYNATTGATVNASLVSGLNRPWGIAVSGGNLFITSSSDGTVREYTTSGATVNASLIPASPGGRTGIAVFGGNLFVANYKDGGPGTIGEYTTSGATVNASLVSVGRGPLGIAVVPDVTVESSWTGTNSTNWAISGNWSGAIPGATAGTTNGDTAAFKQNSPNSPQTIDAGRNLQNITFDTASVNSLTIGTIGGQALLLTGGGTVQTTSTVVNPQTANCPLVLEGDYSFTSGASSSSATLNFGGRVAPGVTSGITVLTLNGGNIGMNTVSGILADNGAGKLAVAKNGAGVWILSGANSYSGGTTVSGGTLKFNIASGTPTIAAGATATVASGATLELAGSVSALGTSGGNRVHLVNNSTAAGVVVSGTNQVAGAIDGSGDVQVNAGNDLTADHIIQNALIIGGTAASHGLVTINAADASGNPQTVGLSLAGSLASNGTFAADIRSTDLIDVAVSNVASSAGSEFTTGNLSASAGSAAVPEPSTLALAGCGIAIAAIVLLRCRQCRLKAPHFSLTTVN
jgi:autotransporter-associated beta strand protein